MTRMEALEARAAAARHLAWRSDELTDALAAEPQPQGQMVTVALAVWRTSAGDIEYTVPGSPIEGALRSVWTRLGTVMLPLDQERGR